MPSSRMFNGLLLSVTSVTAQAREFEESKSADIATGVKTISEITTRQTCLKGRGIKNVSEAISNHPPVEFQ